MNAIFLDDNKNIAVGKFPKEDFSIFFFFYEFLRISLRNIFEISRVIVTLFFRRWIVDRYFVLTG